MDKTAFREELLENLTHNILPYWLDRMSDPEGGYFGRRDGHDRLHPDAPKGAILNARILWTFSAAYLATGRYAYAEAAQKARDYIERHFIDREYGGVYWSVTNLGLPLDTRKQYYAIAFTIYGLAEHFRATGDPRSLALAQSLFEDIETHSRDREWGGYFEASTREWGEIADMRLSDKDENACKTMNTHLHILEAYTALLRVWRDPRLEEAVRILLAVFLDIIQDSATGHMGLFFDADWKRLDSEISYGHDIEASWLLLETAEVLGDAGLRELTLASTRRMACAALEGRQPDGSMIYERHADGTLDADRHWWVQAENVIGQTYLWKFHGMAPMLDAAMQSWDYIKREIVDSEEGEWFWSRRADGSVNRNDDKAGFWKCPYHNSRMCLETARLLADDNSASC